MLTIIDYGMGNLRSVQKSIEKLGYTAHVSSSPKDIEKATALILPGVGAFGAAMKNLKDYDLISVIKEKVSQGTPFLGICLGLQVLFDRGDEAPDTAGLGLIKGTVPLFSFGDTATERLPIPHMGWNQVEQKKSGVLFKGIPDNAFFYFVHSYYARPDDTSIISGQSSYGIPFTAAIEHGTMFATQFHPEKSSPWGLVILKNFIQYTKK